MTTLPTHLLSYENILSNISDSLFTYVMVVIFVTTLALMNWDLILIDREARNEHNNEEIIIRLLPENHEEAVSHLFLFPYHVKNNNVYRAMKGLKIKTK